MVFRGGGSVRGRPNKKEKTSWEKSLLTLCPDRPIDDKNEQRGNRISMHSGDGNPERFRCVDRGEGGIEGRRGSKGERDGTGSLVAVRGMSIDGIGGTQTNSEVGLNFARSRRIPKPRKPPPGRGRRVSWSNPVQRAHQNNWRRRSCVIAGGRHAITREACSSHVRYAFSSGMATEGLLYRPKIYIYRGMIAIYGEGVTLGVRW